MFAATDTGAWIVLSVTATLTRPVCCWADAGAASARGSMRPTRVAMRRRFAVCVWCMWFLLPIAARRQASGQGTRDRGRGWHRPPPSAHNRSERHLLAPSLAPERNPPSLDLWLVMGIPAGRGPTTATGRRRQPPNVPEVGAQLAPAARVTRARVAPSRCHLVRGAALPTEALGPGPRDPGDASSASSDQPRKPSAAGDRGPVHPASGDADAAPAIGHAEHATTGTRAWLLRAARIVPRR